MNVRLTIIRITFAALLLLTTCSYASAQPRSQVAFKIEERELIPEGIAYDPRAKVFYVSSTFKRKIVSVDEKGVPRDFTSEAQDGLLGAVGMKVDAKRRLLWVISSNAGDGMPGKGLGRDCLGCSAVFKYDLKTGRLVKKYALNNKPNTHFLNDLTINSSGDAYITDSATGDIYLVSRKQDELEVFTNVGEKASPNGIDLSGDQRFLFMAAGGGIRAVDLRDRSTRTLKMPDGVSPMVIDGLYYFKRSLIAIQPFAEKRKVVRYHLDEGTTAITRVEVIESDHPMFQQPTTGVLVDEDLYYIANSQLQYFRSIYKPDGAYDKSQLQSVVVLKVRLQD